MSYSNVQASQTFCNGTDSQGNNFSTSSNSQESFANQGSCGSGGPVISSTALRRSNASGSVLEFSSDQINPHFSKVLVKDELRQVSNSLQTEIANQHDRNLMSQLAEVSKNSEKELISFKEQNHHAQRLLLEKIGYMEKLHGENSSAQIKLLESIKATASNSEEVKKDLESVSSNLKDAVQTVNQSLTRNIADVSSTLNDILEQVKSKPVLRCDVCTQYSPQIQAAKSTPLKETTNSCKGIVSKDLRTRRSREFEVSPLIKSNSTLNRRTWENHSVPLPAPTFAKSGEHIKQNSSLMDDIFDDEEEELTEDEVVSTEDESVLPQHPKTRAVSNIFSESEGEDMDDWFRI